MDLSGSRPKGCRDPERGYNLYANDGALDVFGKVGLAWIFLR